MPALCSRSRWPMRAAASQSPSTIFGRRPKLGAFSTTFWCRRCTEQSRSCRWSTLPCWSPRICTSMCLARADVLLEEDRAIAEGALRLGLRFVEQLLQILRLRARRACRARRRRTPP